MDRKTLLLITILFAFIVLGMIIFAGVYGDERVDSAAGAPDTTQTPVASDDRPSTSDVPPSVDIEEVGVDVPPLEFTDVVFSSRYDGTEYTISGVLTLPNPCFDVTHETSILESYPEQIRVDFTAIPNADMCVQAIDEHPFTAIAQASEMASVTVFVNGERIEANLE